MSTFERVIESLFAWMFPPDCEECGRRDPRMMLGSWWHADDCSHNAPLVAGGPDDE